LKTGGHTPRLLVPGSRATQRTGAARSQAGGPCDRGTRGGPPGGQPHARWCPAAREEEGKIEDERGEAKD